MGKVKKAKPLTVDQSIRKLVDKHGNAETLAALCREFNRRGMPVLYRKCNRVYEWLVKDDQDFPVRD